jgi:hypothetical protein
LGEVDFVADQFAALDAPMSLTVFSGADEAFLTELRFYVIVQQAEKEEPVYWFRMYSRQKELAHVSTGIKRPHCHRFCCWYRPSAGTRYPLYKSF